MSVYIPKAKYLLLEVSTTTLSPSFWHHDVSTRDWGKVSTATGQYYYIESQYLTYEVSTHPWGQVSTARGQYYYIEFKYLTHEVRTHHWDQVASARCQYYYFNSMYLRPSFYCKRLVLLPCVPIADTMMSVHITEAKFLLLEVSTTTLSPSIWHLKSEPITEAKFLLLEVSTTTLSPSGWQIDVSTHP